VQKSAFSLLCYLEMAENETTTGTLPQRKEKAPFITVPFGNQVTFHSLSYG